MSNKEVVKDVRTAVQLEQELQISYAQRGVAVLDIYSAEWGPCKAITESFRRLATDQGDGVHLRFLSVECHAILASLKHPEEQRNPQRPKNIEAIRDTLPEGWQSILQERAGQSKPYFLFYKEGKKAGFVEGVQTPQIREVVKDLCAVKTPASEFITNPRLQEFWDECFNPEESDVPLDKFFKGLLQACKYTVAFSDAEKAILVDSLGIKDNKDKNVVTAEGLQKWIGDDEVKTVPVLIAEALPEYEARAAATIEREAEERKAQEAQRAREAEEEATRKAAEKIAQEEAAKAAAKPADETLEDLVKQVPELSNAPESLEGEEEAAIRSSIQSAELSVPAQATKVSLLTGEAAAEQALGLIEVVQNANTLSQWLQSNKSLVFVNAARIAVDEKITSKQSSSAKLASFLAASDKSVASTTSGYDIDFREELLTGNLFAAAPALASSLSCTAAVAAPSSLVLTIVKEALEGGQEALLSEGSTFVLPPLTVVSTGEQQSESFKVVLQGIPHAIALGAEVFATHWFAAFAVTNVSDTEVVASFSEFVAQDAFDTAATVFSTSTNRDEKKFEVLGRIQARVAQGETVPDRPPQAEAAVEEVAEEPAEADAPPASSVTEESAPEPPVEEAPSSSDPVDAAEPAPTTDNAEETAPEPAAPVEADASAAPADEVAAPEATAEAPGDAEVAEVPEVTEAPVEAAPEADAAPTAEEAPAEEA